MDITEPVLFFTIIAVFAWGSAWRFRAEKYRKWIEGEE